MSDAGFSDGCAWIAHEFLPIERAAIPITDTGFTRSDVTYDVVAVWNGQFFRLDDHLDRFERSARKLRMQAPLDRAEITEVLHECVARAGLREAYVEMILTRGVPRAGDRDPRNFENRFYAFAIPYVWIANPEQQREGIRIVIARGTERISADAVDPTVKNFHWGDLVQGLFEAYDRDAHTAILLDGDGNVTEGPGFNLFAYCDGCLLTPSSGVLEGITRRTVMELAAEQGIDTLLATIRPLQLLSASEVFVCSTAGGVMPVSTVDDKVIGDGKPGLVTMALHAAYWRAHDHSKWTVPVRYSVPSAASAG